jgi:hypothetical protein
LRISIPQDIPHPREIGPEAQKPTISQQPESGLIQRHLVALEERAGQHWLNHEPPRRTKTVRKELGPSVRPRIAQDPREVPDTRRVPRNRFPSQTIGMQLRPEECRAMLELGRFRVVRTADLANTLYDGKQRKLDEDLRYLRSKGLIETRYVNLRRDGRRRQIDRIEVATLTKSGRAWLRKSGEVPEGQTVYAGFVKPREMEHDSLIYRAYQKESAKITELGGTQLRVRLDFEIKAEVQKAMHAERKAEPSRDLTEIRQQIALEQELPFINGRIQIPDARIEFDRPVEQDDQGSRTGHQDIEVLTAAYRASHLRTKAQAGFHAYAAGADYASITARIEDDHDLMRDILDL